VSALVEIIFCPYNYLVDPKIRSSVCFILFVNFSTHEIAFFKITKMSINLKDQIVIFDEAHNIEDVSRSSTTFCITQSQMEICLEELKRGLVYAVGDEVCQAMQYFAHIVNIIIY
jgi:Rad3-related DNA helicase